MKRKFIEQSYYDNSTSSSVPHSVIKETVKAILSIASKELKREVKTLSVLDVGSGWGEYSFEFEKYVKKVVGVEPWKRGYLAAMEKNKKLRRSKVQFYNSLIENFKTKDRFDLAISLTTLEHMPNAEKSFARIFSLLKPGGMIYVTAPNKLWPIEPHYKLPFLNWLPLSTANLYIRIMRKGSSFQDSSYAKTYFGMKRFFDQFPCTCYFWVPPVDAAYLGCGSGNSPIFKMMRKFGIWLIKKFSLFWIISKGFIVVVRKTNSDEFKSY